MQDNLVNPSQVSSKLEMNWVLLAFSYGLEQGFMLQNLIPLLALRQGMEKLFIALSMAFIYRRGMCLL